MENKLFFMLLLIGGIFLLAGYILFKHPPKKINFLYGYRTKRSMQSQEVWDFAQVYAARLLMKFGGAFIALSLLSLLINLPDGIEFLLIIGILVMSSIALIATTEKAIKSKFESHI